LRVVSHGGDTPEAFAAGLAAGADMVEVDVLPRRADGTGELYLAHDYGDLRARPDALTLGEGLEHLAALGVDVDLDLKLPGYEERVVAALDRHRLDGRVLVSTMEMSSLRRLRALRPGLRLGWSVPRIHRDPFRSPLLVVPALAGVQVLRRVLPRRAAAGVRTGLADAVMVNRLLVTGALVRSVGAAGGDVYVWTVDSEDEVRRFAALGVTGVVTNEPRLVQPISQVAAE
jgi:glycerophosphoryl diester phosphodiesterase